MYKKIEMFSNHVTVFQSRNDPFVYIHKNSLQYFSLTLQLEWTNHCAYFNTYSKYD